MDPKLAYEWIFVFAIGNIIKKDLCLETTFDNNLWLERVKELVDLLHSSKINITNIKRLIFEMIDDEKSSPFDLAKQLNFIIEGNISSEDLEEIIN